MWTWGAQPLCSIMTVILDPFLEPAKRPQSRHNSCFLSLKVCKHLVRWARAAKKISWHCIYEINCQELYLSRYVVRPWITFTRHTFGVQSIGKRSKSEFLAQSEFSLTTFCVELGAEIDMKAHKIWRRIFFSKLCLKWKVPILQVWCSYVELLRRFLKKLRGHASVCPCILESLAEIGILLTSSTNSCVALLTVKGHFQLSNNLI